MRSYGYTIVAAGPSHGRNQCIVLEVMDRYIFSAIVQTNHALCDDNSEDILRIEGPAFCWNHAGVELREALPEA